MRYLDYIIEELLNELQYMVDADEAYNIFKTLSEFNCSYNEYINKPYMNIIIKNVTEKMKLINNNIDNDKLMQLICQKTFYYSTKFLNK